ncbi:hypothetical protein A4244_02175 [Bacillus badius]|nr:hypothetical protein A4244_02175 [Bacillus badius]OCS88104.1 hypothetical protein A6M11_02175 [Bacillus badius]OVE53370.1 hypothetical protein B1A98_00745 [Bacillus badius]
MEDGEKVRNKQSTKKACFIGKHAFFVPARGRRTRKILFTCLIILMFVLLTRRLAARMVCIYIGSLST